MSWYLIVLAGMAAWTVRDALLDKTPRVPRKPERAWWTARRSARERLKVHVRVGRKAV